MEILERLKNEPRVVIAVAGIICFCFPFFNLEITGSVMGESFSAGSQIVSGLQLLNVSFLCIILYIAAIFQVVLPLMKNKDLVKKLYLILPVVEIIFMFITYILLMGKGGVSADNDYGDVESKIRPVICFWLVILCNGAIFIWTAVHDYKIKNKDDIKRSISNINLKNISGQATETIRELSGTLHAAGSIECPNCHQKGKQRKKFCAYCGTPFPEQEIKAPEKEMQKCNSCGNMLPKGAKFCQKCGHELGSEN